MFEKAEGKKVINTDARVGKLHWTLRLLFLLLMIIAWQPVYTQGADDSADFGITSAQWDSGTQKLTVTGYGAGKKKTVKVRLAETGKVLGKVRSTRDGEFTFSKRVRKDAPCDLLVERYDGVQVPAAACQGGGEPPGSGEESDFGISDAQWDSGNQKLTVTGYGAGKKKTVKVRLAETGKVLGKVRSTRDGEFTFSKRVRKDAPCDLLVERYDGVQVPAAACQGGGEPPGSEAGNDFVLLAWNDLGMHCMDGMDYSVFSILPPFNNLHAQLIRRDGTQNKLVNDGVTLTYEAAAYDNGSINTTSAQQTNYWDFVDLLYEPLFGPTKGEDFGLTGNPVQSRETAPLAFNKTFEWWEAEGIPTDPYDDQGRKEFYPLVRLTATDSSGRLLAATTTVLPVSDEMDCRTCHASGSSSAAQPKDGWENQADPDKDYKYNILKLHDDRQDISAYRNTLQKNGYPYGSSLYETAKNGTPVLCASCHGSNALPGSGVDGISMLTAAVHARHADAVDPGNGQRLDDTNNRAACYSCHPGAETQCLRGAMGAALKRDGSTQMDCQSCHGNMSDVGRPGRVGWLEEPTCQSCHFDGQRLTEASAIPPAVIGDTRFATNPDTPFRGTNLFRFSKGHGGLQCEACHGATHAIYPSAEEGDNLQSIAVQGHEGTIAECSACHSTVPFTADKGPHGMHTVGLRWVDRHGDVAEKDASPCAACHGQNFRGNVTSMASMDRTFRIEEGSIQLKKRHAVSCYDCHDGPRGDD